MLKKSIILLVLVAGTGAVLAAESFYPSVELHRWFLTFVWLTVIYFVFKVVLEGYTARRIQDNKNRYKFRKTISLIYIAVFLIVLVRVWVEDPQSLLVAYGLVAAGVAISLQDLFKNFVGGFLLLINNIYRVGDRVEIDGMHGDIIDIGLFYTTLLEIRGWVDGDQATGRLTYIPNGKLLGGSVNNYTKDHHFIWEEITLPITYESDWRKAQEIVKELVTESTQEITEQAQQGIERIGQKYYMSKRNTEPNVFIRMTDNWIEFKVRFVVDVRNRRFAFNDISQKILAAIEAEDEIDIASETLVVTQGEFPGN